MSVSSLVGTIWEWYEAFAYGGIPYDGVFSVNFKAYDPQTGTESTFSSMTLDLVNNFMKYDDSLIASNYNWNASYNLVKRIEFIGGADASNNTLIGIMETQAKLVSSASVVVEYDGDPIVIMYNEDTKTLNTSGKYCEDDIVVKYAPSGSGVDIATISIDTGTATYTNENMEIVSASYPQGVKSPIGTIVFVASSSGPAPPFITLAGVTQIKSGTGYKVYKVTG